MPSPRKIRVSKPAKPSKRSQAAAIATTQADNAAISADNGNTVDSNPASVLGAEAAAQAPFSNVAGDTASAEHNVSVAAIEAANIMLRPASLNAVTTTDANGSTTSHPAIAVPSRGIERDAAGIVRQRTNFDLSSDRDTAYLRFFASVAATRNGTCTLLDLHNAGSTRDESGRKRYNPFYAGSSKATDIGAFNRLVKAGFITFSPDGHTLTVTARGATMQAYASFVPATVATVASDDNATS